MFHTTFYFDDFESWTWWYTINSGFSDNSIHFAIR